MIGVRAIVEAARRGGGREVRVEVTPEFFAQAERGLYALESRRARRSTPATLVEDAPTMRELNADAWRRARRGEP